MKRMTIGNVARAAAVGVETVRLYERRGLIERPPKPPSAGFRVYPEETVRRIRFIRKAQKVGFSLREIGELLSVRADPAAECAQVCERAAVKLDEVNRRLEQLQRFRAALERLIAACPRSGPLRACFIMAALTDDRSDAERCPGTG